MQMPSSPSRLETNLFYLPLAYKLAIEWLDQQADRTAADLETACERYERATGMDTLSPDDKGFYRRRLAAIAARRFYNFQA